MKKLNNDKIELMLEKYITVLVTSIVTLIVIILICKLKINNIEIPKIDFLLSSVITVVTTIIGFLLTGLTIIMSLMQTKVMKIIIKNSGEKLLSKYIMSPIIWGILLIINILLTGYLLKDDNTINKYMLIITIFLLTIFAIGTIRVSYFMKKMFLKVSEEYRENDIQSNIKKAKKKSVKFLNR